MENINFDELRKSFSGELFTGKIRKLLLATDASMFQVEPLAVAYPKNTNDVVSVVKFADKHHISVHPRGTGSGLCGGAVGRGIVIDFSKYMNKLISFTPDQYTFTCEPGYKCGELEQLLKGTGLFFPPAPSSGEYASFGGMFSTNAGGAYSVKYGNVADYLLDAEVVFADGTVRVLNDIVNLPYEQLPMAFKNIYNTISSNMGLIKDSYPDVPCNVSGYELRHLTDGGKLHLHKLLGGAEGTLGIVTKLTFRLQDKFKYNTLIVAYFDDIVSSSKAAQLALNWNPAGIEIMDKSLLKIAIEHEPSLAGTISQGHDNVLMIEFESNDLSDVENVTKECTDAIKKEKYTAEISLAITEADKAQFWAVRKAAVPILYLLKGDKKIVALVEDAAVPVDKLVAYFNGMYDIFGRHNTDFVLYGHIAKGLIHARPLLNIKDSEDRKKLKYIADDVFNMVSSLGGTISGEHGDGRIRSCYIPRQYRNIYEFFTEIKNELDPYGRFNPDIKTYHNEFQMTENLRYEDDYVPVDISTNLVWNDGIINEIEKCHGCSKCTTVTTVTRMCPMYKIHRDEASAPKAKANILRGLISGNISDEAIYEKTFYEVVSRCVNCGSCSRECPSHVNIPKLALEAKSHYVNKFGVSMESRLAVNFEIFARYSRKIFPLVTPIMRFKAMRKIAEKMTGIASEREFIKFQTKSIYERIDEVSGSGSKKVLYFAGCYASYVRPEIAESTINMLHRLGYQVLLPEQFCCGIPHISKGMTEDGKNKIEDNIRSWGKLIEQVDHIVVSCSSCGLALTKEWSYLLGGEVVDKIKKITVHISKIIEEHINELNTKGFGLSIGYHSSCHMKLMPDPDVSWRIISKLNEANVGTLANSCCGMAGSWGTSAANYDESVKIASPLVSSVKNGGYSICVTDCPTCEMQLNHLLDKPVYHPVEIFDKLLEK